MRYMPSKVVLLADHESTIRIILQRLNLQKKTEESSKKMKNLCYPANCYV